MGAPARFIVLDGLDGCGKSTQAARLAGWLRATHGLDVDAVRDPGSTPIGEEIRSVLLGHRSAGMAASTELLLYQAARAQLVAERIRPALEAGRWVVSDRFVLSTLAYQGHGLGASRDAIRGAAAVAVGETEPDLTVVLDIDPAAGLGRAGGTPDRIEARGTAYLAAVRAGFLAEAAADAERVIVVDASAAVDAVAADVQRAVLPLLEGSPRE